jgi:hypothetical protein
MGLGFAPVKSEQEKPKAKRPFITPIDEIQSNLLELLHKYFVV